MKFNHRLILRITAVVLLFQGIAMLLPLFAASYYHESASATAFAAMSIISISFGTTIYRFYPAPHYSIKNIEGYYIVFLSWLIVIVWGALPYYFSGSTYSSYSFYDCIFESTAGWTTTGSTVWDYSLMPKSIILWKSISSWLGGMGIILLTASIFPRLGIGGQKMAAAEIPGPQIEKITARFGDTGKISYMIYITLTIAEFLMLLPTKMGLYNSLVNTLSSISTSGMIFSHSNDVGLLFTPYIKMVISFFSIAASVNFIAYFLFVNRKIREAIHFYEIKIYIILLAIATGVIGVSIYFGSNTRSILSSFVDAFAQSVSFAATSGFVVGDIGNWPTITKVILILLSLIGGCSASTAGGLKVIRFAVMIKLIGRGIYKRIHPRSIKPIMIQNNPISPETASNITVYILLYFGLMIFSALIISLNDLDLETTLCASIGSFTNTGTSFGLLTKSDYSIFNPMTKIYLSFLMLAGRLEIYAILILLSRSYWNSDRIRN